MNADNFIYIANEEDIAVTLKLDQRPVTLETVGAPGPQGIKGADSTVPGPVGPQGNAGDPGEYDPGDLTLWFLNQLV